MPDGIVQVPATPDSVFLRYRFHTPCGRYAIVDSLVSQEYFQCSACLWKWKWKTVAKFTAEQVAARFHHLNALVVDAEQHLAYVTSGAGRGGRHLVCRPFAELLKMVDESAKPGAQYSEIRRVGAAELMGATPRAA